MDVGAARAIKVDEGWEDDGGLIVDGGSRCACGAGKN